MGNNHFAGSSLETNSETGQIRLESIQVGTRVTAAQFKSLLDEKKDWSTIATTAKLGHAATKLIAALCIEPGVARFSAVQQALERTGDKQCPLVCTKITNFAREHFRRTIASGASVQAYPAFVKLGDRSDHWVGMVWQHSDRIAPKLKDLAPEERTALENIISASSCKKSISPNASVRTSKSKSSAGCSPIRDSNTQRRVSSEAIPKIRLLCHMNHLNSLSFNVHGNLFSASADSTIRCWDLKSRQTTAIFKGHTGPINSAFVSIDGRLVSGSADGTVRVWNAKTGSKLRELSGHSAPVNWVIQGLNNEVISASADGTLRVWSLDNYKFLFECPGHAGPVNHAVMCWSGQLISASADGTLRIWDFQNKRKPLVLKGHTSYVNSVVVTDVRAISASADGTLRIWEIDSGRLLYTLEGHTAPINKIALTDTEDLVVSASADRTLRVWSVTDGRCKGEFREHDGGINDLAITHDRFCISASADKTLRMWDLKSLDCVSVLRGHKGSVRRVAITPNRRFVFSGSFDQMIFGWDLNSVMKHR
jgi:WD40 repeat protein